MNQSLKISIIVPVYKVEPYIDRCIKSLISQTYQNIEIILVDDGEKYVISMRKLIHGLLSFTNIMRAYPRQDYQDSKKVRAIISHLLMVMIMSP